MTEQRPHFHASHARPSLLAGLLIVQALAAVFFLGDVVADFRLERFNYHLLFEAGVTLALVTGLIFSAVEMRRALERIRRGDAAVAAASGALAELIQAYFDHWHLTPAEADVALLALKGLETGDIANLRGAAQGTVRAQLTRVYAKAGVSNRAQLLSLLIEDLLAGPVAQGDRNRN